MTRTCRAGSSTAVQEDEGFGLRILAEVPALRFPNVSAGLLGHLHNRSTLNSRYQAVVLGGELWRHAWLPFPQRIPVLGFFEELQDVEGTAFRELFAGVSRRLAQELADLLAAADWSEEGAGRLYGLASILLRRGEARELRGLHALLPDHPAARPVRLIAAEAELIDALSCEERLETGGFLEIAKAAVRGELSGEPLQLKALARLIVVTHRHAAPEAERAQALEFLPAALDLLQKLARADDFSSCLACSFAARGLAMASSQGDAFQRAMLDTALRQAERARPLDELERLVADENLVVLMQTLAKWNEQHGDEPAALRCVERMIELDPEDATGYSELGFLWSRRGRSEEALEAFSAAVRQGPPGLSLNTFFVGQCLEALGRRQEAAGRYLESASIDPHALSPLLALFQLCREGGDSAGAREVACEILDQPEVCGQLQPEEHSQLTGFLGALR